MENQLNLNLKEFSENIKRKDQELFEEISRGSYLRKEVESYKIVEMKLLESE